MVHWSRSVVLRLLAYGSLQGSHSASKLICGVHWCSLVGATEDMPVNVRAPQCITGGAAGAAAAAVAAGEVSFAVDTDHLAGVRVRAALLQWLA